MLNDTPPRRVAGVGQRSTWDNLAHSGFTVRDANYGLVYTLNIYGLLGMLSLGVFGVLHILVEHNPLVGYTEIAGALGLFLTLVGVRFTKNIVLGRNSFLLILLIMLMVMLVSGGTAGTGIFWFFMFPVSAFLLTNKTQGWLWMSALIASIIALAILQALDMGDLAYDALTIRQLVITLIIVTFGIYSYQLSRERLQRQTDQSQYALKEEKTRADTILDNIDIGVVAIDTTGKLIVINQAAAEMLGWQSNAVMGKLFTDVMPLIDHEGRVIPLEDRPLHQALSGKRTEATLSYKRHDGSIFPVTMVCRPIVVNGQTIGAICAFRDVTQEQAIDHAKTEFVTLASHQLRTPLAAISWYGEMLINGDAGKLTEDQSTYVQQIYQSTQRSTAMVEAMLTASSLELGNVSVKPEPTDIATVLHQGLHALLGSVGAGKKINIVEEYDKTLQPVPLDLKLTRTIFQNLIANAIKYTPEGGTVTLRATASNQVLHTGSAGSVLIEITDTGYGIPKREQAKVFSRLFRADNVKKKDTDGTGLGLFIVKTALEYTGGSVSFVSNEGKGTTFSVYLPVEGMRRHF